MVDNLQDGSVSDYPNENGIISSLDTGTPLKSRSVQDRPNQQNHQQADLLDQAAQGNTLKPSESHLEYDQRPNSIPASPLDNLEYNADESSANSGANLKFVKRDEANRILRDYFHDLLVYINKNDATLANDRDGELAYFMRQMPVEELDMVFADWVENKLKKIKTDFVRDSEEKIRTLRLDFERAQNFITSLDDEDLITAIAYKLDLL